MKIAISLAFFFATLAQAATVHIVDGSTRSKVIRLLKQGQRIGVSAEEMQVELGPSLDPDAAANADILMLHDPQTGLFFWRYQDSGPDRPGGIIERFERDSALCAKDDKLVEFHFLGASLWVREFKEKYSTMNEARAALMSQLERYGHSMKSVALQSYREINLAEQLGADFLYRRGNANPSKTPRLREVSASGAGWRVVLDGPNGDAAVVTLGEHYEVEGTAPLK